MPRGCGSTSAARENGPRIVLLPCDPTLASRARRSLRPLAVVGRRSSLLTLRWKEASRPLLRSTRRRALDAQLERPKLQPRPFRNRTQRLGTEALRVCISPVCRALLPPSMRPAGRSGVARRDAAIPPKEPSGRTTLDVLLRLRLPSIPLDLRSAYAKRRLEPPRREGRGLPAAVQTERPSATGVPRGAARCRHLPGSARKVAGGLLKAEENQPKLWIVGSDSSGRGSRPSFSTYSAISSRTTLQARRRSLAALLVFQKLSTGERAGARLPLVQLGHLLPTTNMPRSVRPARRGIFARARIGRMNDLGWSSPYQRLTGGPRTSMSCSATTAMSSSASGSGSGG